jgi:hypothetical protein
VMVCSIARTDSPYTCTDPSVQILSSARNTSEDIILVLKGRERLLCSQRKDLVAAVLKFFDIWTILR